MTMLRKSVLLCGLVVATGATSVVSLPVQAQKVNAGNVIGGIAEALIGSSIGQGNGRAAAAAVGGIVGTLLGGNVERNSDYYAGNSVEPAYPPQRSYSNAYAQSQLQYRQPYDSVTYAQPVYPQGTYERPYTASGYSQPPYRYVQPLSMSVYSPS